MIIVAAVLMMMGKRQPRQTKGEQAMRFGTEENAFLHPLSDNKNK